MLPQATKLDAVQGELSSIEATYIEKEATKDRVGCCFNGKLNLSPARTFPLNKTNTETYTPTQFAAYRLFKKHSAKYIDSELEKSERWSTSQTRDDIFFAGERGFIQVKLYNI